MIAKELLNLLAPNLSYSVDEALEHANILIKGDAKDVFDLSLTQDFDYDFGIDDTFLMSAREKFFEQIDMLKKDKIIKSTLELNLNISFDKFPNEELADWFMVSQISNENEEILAEFEVENEKFKITKASLCKCPRCWKFQSKNEETPCLRCEEVLKGVQC